jgi:hypothetical protein
VTIDWSGYELHEPRFSVEVRDLPRTEARQIYRRFLETRAARILLLRRLLEANGLELGTDNASVQKLNDWVFESVEPNPDLPGELTVDWYSLVQDIGTFLGELLIERRPTLHWEFFTWGKTDVSYQMPVIMGIATENPKFRTNIDPVGMVETYAHRVVEQMGSIPTYGKVTVRGLEIDVDAISAQHRQLPIPPDVFVEWLERSERRA